MLKGRLSQDTSRNSLLGEAATLQQQHDHEAPRHMFMQQHTWGPLCPLHSQETPALG